MTVFRALSTLGILVSLSAPAIAQDLSDEEILGILEAQRDAVKNTEAQSLGATRSLTGAGPTRGVALIALEDLAQPQTETAAAPAQTDTAPAETEQAQVSDPNTALTPASADAKADPDKTLAVFEEDLQLNVRISFGFDSAVLPETEKPKLAQMCRVMAQSDVDVFRIVGHTDAAGSDEYNRRLSVLRAEEVARHLIEDCQIDAGRLQTVGVGERFLVNVDNPRADENRRVEFQAIL